MIKYCPNPAFDAFIALPPKCNLEAVIKRFKEDYPLYELRTGYGDYLRLR
jgi:hypothetical protein